MFEQEKKPTPDKNKKSYNPGDIFEKISEGKDTVVLDKDKFIELFESFNSNTYSSEEFGGWLQVADIRNKLSPVTTLVSLIERLNSKDVTEAEKIKINEIIIDLIVTIKESVGYLAQRDDLF